MNNNSNRNILLVSNYPSDVGYAWWLMEHFWVLLSEHFSKKGGGAYLAYPSITTLPETIRNSNIEVVELTVPGTSRAERAALKKFIQTNKITDIYLTDRPWFSLSYLDMRIFGIRNIVIHDHTPGDRPAIQGVRGLVKAIRHRLPLVCADSQLCVSELMRQRSINNARLPSNRCITVQNGIPPVKHQKNQRSVSRHKLNISERAIVCITTGRAHPYKRFDFIIQVAEECVKRQMEQELLFLLIGDGPALEALQEELEQRKLKDNIRLLGFRSDARDLLAAADFAMHAALGEGFSLSIVEYMSAQLPVLVPDIPSVKQAIDHGINGLVYGANDINDATLCIQRLAASKKLRLSMGLSAKTKADAEYSLTMCSERFKKGCLQVFRR